MPFKDLARNFDYSQSIDPASYTATKTGDEVDLTSVDSALVVVNIGAVATADASNLFTFTLTQATASGGTFAAADSGQYDVVDSWDRLINATAEANDVKAFNFRPAKAKPYVKVVATETGTASAIFGATVIFTKTRQPAST